MSGFHNGLTTCFIIVPTTYINWLTNNKETKKNNSAMKEKKRNSQNEKISQVINSFKTQKKGEKLTKLGKESLKFSIPRIEENIWGLGWGDTNLAKPRRKTTNRVKQQAK